MTQKRHILLVEDDPFLGKLLGTELAKHGYLVIKAENGLQALALIKGSSHIK